MKLHELKNPNKDKAPKRKGRGTATGQGKTAGRGQDGQKSRSGGGVRLGFEGGQMPLYRRIPKRGFKNALWKKDIATLNLSALDAFDDGAEVDEKTLREKGLVKKGKDGIKILGGGEIKKKLVVKATAFSKSASDKIVAAGGKYEVIG
jgi:large subunit ribosomal protein L15